MYLITFFLKKFTSKWSTLPKTEVLVFSFKLCISPILPCAWWNSSASASQAGIAEASINERRKAEVLWPGFSCIFTPQTPGGLWNNLARFWVLFFAFFLSYDMKSFFERSDVMNHWRKLRFADDHYKCFLALKLHKLIGNCGAFWWVYSINKMLHILMGCFSHLRCCYASYSILWS